MTTERCCHNSLVLEITHRNGERKKETLIICINRLAQTLLFSKMFQEGFKEKPERI